MNVLDRVRKHRAHLKEQGCGRLEVSISVATIDQLRKMARYKGQSGQLFRMRWKSSLLNTGIFSPNVGVSSMSRPAW